MAMTKKEAAAFEALQNEIRLAKALRWTEQVAIDVPPPGFGEMHEKISKGWLYNAYNLAVNPACSSSIHHSSGRDDKTTTLGAKWLYSTRKLALQAMRNEVEREAAAKLAKIDAEIEKCAD